MTMQEYIKAELQAKAKRQQALAKQQRDAEMFYSELHGTHMAPGKFTR